MRMVNLIIQHKKNSTRFGWCVVTCVHIGTILGLQRIEEYFTHAGPTLFAADAQKVLIHNLLAIQKRKCFPIITLIAV